jgi:very-short-patch-repair endonuclease
MTCAIFSTGEVGWTKSLSPIGGEGRVRGQVCERSGRYAPRLRQSATKAERKLWFLLRNRQFGGLKFRRQHPIGPFVTDFCCTEAKLIVELDGGHHALERRSDAERTRYLEAQGYRVLRFWNNEALSSVDGVLQRIALALGVYDRPSPYPLPGGERDSDVLSPNGERALKRRSSRRLWE